MACDGISGDFSFQNTQGAKGGENSLIKTLKDLNPNGFINMTKVEERHPQDAIMNKDGSITVITKWNDGKNSHSREVNFVYDKDGNKVIKSVKTSSAELYGTKSTEKVLIDKDGDGYADEAVIKETDGDKVTEKTIKYPKVDEKTDKHELAHQGRDMEMQARGLVCYEKKI